jgi:DNA invertase Pin-like site-specific DNA recombinase
MAAGMASNLAHELEQKGAGLRVLEPEFCTSTDTGRILVTVLGTVTEMERRFILEHQKGGFEAAKKRRAGPQAVRAGR